jgi:acyl carrier protein
VNVQPFAKTDFSHDVHEFVASNFLFGVDATLQDDASFLDSGVVDSTGVLELVMFLERKYNVKISTDEITPDNLDSISRVVRFVASKLGAVSESSVFEAVAKSTPAVGRAVAQRP